MAEPSLDWAVYTEQTLTVLAIEATSTQVEAVADHVAQIAAIAAPLLAFPLPDTLEPLGGFEP